MIGELSMTHFITPAQINQFSSNPLVTEQVDQINFGRGEQDPPKNDPKYEDGEQGEIWSNHFKSPIFSQKKLR